MLPQLKAGAREKIVTFIRHTVEESGASGVAVNLSGGIDSALTLKLCVEALGPGKVHALLLPDRSESGSDEEDAHLFATSLGVHVHRYYIGGIVGEFSSIVGVEDRRVLGNIKARTRMVFVYAVANSLNLLVAGTSNKSEFLTGYYTKFGDGASDFCPIGDLYKSEVRQLASESGVPAVFIEKAPSAGLWAGQTDEGEMGITYAELDTILHSVERGMDAASISSAEGIDLAAVERVLEMVRSSRHKRSSASIPPIDGTVPSPDWPG